MNRTTGDRIRSVRKRRGLSQKELARLCGLSVSWVRQQEQGTAPDPPLETLHKVAVALTVPTSTLAAGAQAPGPHPQTAQDWALVRDALHGRGPEPAEQATAEGVHEILAAVRRPLAANRYAAVAAILPSLIRDAGTLNGHDGGARSRVLNLTAWLLTQTRQWDDAEAAARMARDASRGDRLDDAAAVNTLCWSLLRQGRLAEARELATAEADKIEPRFSAAIPRELAMWGRLLLAATNAAIRDNRPGEAADVLSLARAAAGRIGQEVSLDGSTARTFGPVSVMMIMAENAAITGQPDQVLAIAENIPAVAGALSAGMLHPAAASRCRHRLDTADAYVMLRRYPEAMEVFRGLQEDVPEWLAQQRYARDILRRITDQRRTMTPEMVTLADAINLPLLAETGTSGHGP
jgi:transcriptional regulator with XRE-family HTH domain